MKHTTERPLRAAIYTRVSTEMQVEHGDSLDMQEKELAGYCEYALGITDYEPFVEKGKSGKDMVHREAFQKMMACVRAGEFSHIVVYKLDRLSRNVMDILHLFEEMDKLGVTIVSKSEQLDTSTPAGRFMVTMLAGLAQLEREQTGDRVRDVMVSRAEDRNWNGGRVHFGYDYTSEKQIDKMRKKGIDVTGMEPGFSIVEDEADVIRRIFQDYLIEHSVTKVVRGLNEDGLKTRAGNSWSCTGVWQILKNPWYVGDYRYNRYRGTRHRKKNPRETWVVIKDHHPAIISRSDYDEVQEIIHSQSRYGETKHRHRPWSDHLFRSLVYCGECGLRMNGTAMRTYADGTTRAVVYTCPDHRKGTCDNTTAQERVISDFVFSFLRNLSTLKLCFSKTKQEDLEDILLSSTPLRSVDHIAPASLAALSDTLRRFRTDASYQTEGGMPGRKEKMHDPEIAELRKERHRLQVALKRLDDSYLSPSEGRSPIPQSVYEERRPRLQEQLDEVDKRLGRLRTASKVTVSTDDVYRRMSELVSLEPIASCRVLSYPQYRPKLDVPKTRYLLERVVDSVRVKGGQVVSLTLMDGTKVDFEY